MAKVVKHAWTHHVDGTDPIDVAAAGLPVAIGQSGSAVSTSLGVGLTPIPYRFIAWNDDSLFGYHTVSGTPAKARYITVNRDGVYHVRSLVSWDTSFTLGDDPYLITTVYLVDTATADQLITSATHAILDEWVDLITLGQRNADELDYRSLQTDSTFHFSEVDYGTATLGIGVSLGTLNARTKSIQAYTSVTWLGEPLTDHTVA